MTEKIKFRGKDSIVSQNIRLRRPELFEIGRGSILDDYAYISCGVKIGDFTHVGAQAVMIGGPKAQVTIGNFCNIAQGCKIAAGMNDYHGGGLCGPAIPEGYGDKAIIEPVEIGDHFLCGFNTSILAGVKLPEGVAIGAYSLVKSNIKYEPWTLYAGNPIKMICRRDGTLMKAQADKLMEDVKKGLI